MCQVRREKEMSFHYIDTLAMTADVGTKNQDAPLISKHSKVIIPPVPN